MPSLLGATQPDAADDRDVGGLRPRPPALRPPAAGRLRRAAWSRLGRRLRHRRSEHSCAGHHDQRDAQHLDGRQPLIEGDEARSARPPPARGSSAPRKCRPRSDAAPRARANTGSRSSAPRSQRRQQRLQGRADRRPRPRSRDTTISAAATPIARASPRPPEKARPTRALSRHVRGPEPAGEQCEADARSVRRPRRPGEQKHADRRAGDQTRSSARLDPSSPTSKGPTRFEGHRDPEIDPVQGLVEAEVHPSEASPRKRSPT